MRLLDLFCGAGGAGMGYHRAGFDVIGVDIRLQPRYPFAFVQADALEYVVEHGHEFDAIHASPPCHDHSSLASLSGRDGTGWLNVPGAMVRRDLVLCGEMFGLRTYRHRWFELSFFAMSPAHPPHVVRTSTKKRRACWDAGMHISVTGDVGSYPGGGTLAIKQAAPCECAGLLAELLHDLGVDATFSRRPPVVDSGYQAYVATCEHGVVWYGEPTTEQTAAWARDGVA